MFWIVAFVIAAPVALVLVMGLRRSSGTLSGAASDIAVYKDQLKEVDRDLARGVLSEAEAEAARIEVSRRLLDADARARSAEAATDGRSPVMSVLIVVVVLAGGAGLYGVMGAPGARDLPMKARLAALEAAAANRPSQAEAEALAAPRLPVAPIADPKFVELMERLRAAIAERPDDVQGLALLATNEARLGNFVAAREAQQRMVEVKGDETTVDDLVMLIDMMVFSAGGFVSPEAEVYLHRLTNMDPANGAGRYYAGLMLAQNGRADRAFPIWRNLLESSSPDDPWVPVVSAEIEGLAAAAGVDYRAPVLSGLKGPSAADVAAAQDMTDEDRQSMIRGMVEGLSERLATEGGTPEEWARLIGALGVLGETERAAAIAAEAKEVFAGNADALAAIAGAAQSAGVAK